MRPILYLCIVLALFLAIASFYSGLNAPKTDILAEKRITIIGDMEIYEKNGNVYRRDLE